MDTRRRLFAATLESIHLYGWAATTVTTVTELAGVSRGMVRHSFGSKDAMVAATLRDLCERWVEKTEPDGSVAGPVQVASIVAAMFRDDVLTPTAVDAWLELSVHARSNPELAAIRDWATQQWEDQLTRAFAAAGTPDPTMAAAGVLAAADGLWLRSGLDRSLTSAQLCATVQRVASALLGQDV